MEMIRLFIPRTNTAKSYYERLILTDHGIQKVNDLNATAIAELYNLIPYDGGRKFKIIRFEEVPIDKYIEISTNDGRVQNMSIDEYAVLCGNKKIPFHPHPLLHRPNPEFNTRMVLDPYAYGFLLAVGDFSQEQMSIPASKWHSFLPIAYKYDFGYDADDIRGNNKPGMIYLNKIHTHHQRVFWSAYMHGDMSNVYGIIPKEYYMGTIEERMKLIRGVFDALCNESRNALNVTIQHENMTLVRAVRRILWSLNIESNLQFNPGSKMHSLLVKPGSDLRANFFYNEDYIRENIMKPDDREIIRRDMSMIHIEVKDGKLYNNKNPHILVPIIENPGELYLDIDFMPIASI